MNQIYSELVEELSRSADFAARHGRLDEANSLWQRVLTNVPEHPKALSFTGQFALRSGNLAVARRLLEHASAATPLDPVVLLALARVYRLIGDNTLQLAALDRALVADPYCYPALLEKAALLNQTGQRRHAARLFKDALKITPAPEMLPKEYQDLADRARETVKLNADELEAYVQKRLQEKRRRVDDASRERFEEAVAIVAGTKQIYTQEPSLLYYPRLPAIPYYPRECFPWLERLEAAAPAIREEYLALEREASGDFRPYVAHPPGAPLAQWAELNHSPRWNSLHLWKSGVRCDEQCARCPRTMVALDAVPMISIANFSPTVLFSVLAPHTHLPAHSSVTNVRLVVHLPLIVPPNCRFRVGNETREWRAGEAWVFDDSINHEAWNDSDDYRVILMIDVWNPLLSASEREPVAELLNSVRDYYL